MILLENYGVSFLRYVYMMLTWARKAVPLNVHLINVPREEFMTVLFNLMIAWEICDSIVQILIKVPFFAQMTL